VGVALLAVVVAVARVAVLGSTGDDPVDQAQPGPVIVVPGYAGTASDLAPVVAQLRREGRTVVAFEASQGGTGDLRVQSRRLADLAQRTVERTGAGSVDVVGYSAGGVVARLFVKDAGGASVVRRVLTLGSPHHGTDVAALAEQVAGGCPTACEQLATGSDLIRRLNAGDETPDGPRWITVRTSQDRTVTPTRSAALEGALNIEVQDVCPGATTSHDGLPGDPVVLATLDSALGAGAPTAPADVTC
jgi:pimeloyl-ACP methyl ester carboxylesterase